VKRIVLITITILALFVAVLAQSFTATTANTGLPGRSINRSVLYVDCPHVGDSIYTDTGGIANTVDYSPQELMRGMILSAGYGNIGVILAGGGRMIFPVKVADSTSVVFLKDFQIKTILADSISTFTGRIFPLF
jgi:hypothetical protein